MPTYIVKYSNLKISDKVKQRIASEITRVHNITTGANRYFAQVIFQNLKKNDHYMGGKPISSKEVFVNGQIRSGRTAKIKNKLILGVRNGISNLLKLKKENIWVYLEDLIPEQMIEYGEILPKSGKEKIWFNKLPKSLKVKLKKLDD